MRSGVGVVGRCPRTLFFARTCIFRIFPASIARMSERGAVVGESGMHIMEGFLPVSHAVGWTLAALPCVAAGVVALRRQLAAQPQLRPVLGLAAAFAFVLSALKLPSVSGSSSHATGVGLGALLFGPWVMVPIGTVVLLFQALLLAHGGLTTLGANVFSMAVVGPWVAYGVFRAAGGLGLGLSASVFFAACLGDLATYLCTSIQLAWAFPDPVGGFIAALQKFVGIFAFTQLPLAISEGLLTVLVVNALRRFNAEELRLMPSLAHREVLR